MARQYYAQAINYQLPRHARAISYLYSLFGVLLCVLHRWKISDWFYLFSRITSVDGKGKKGKRKGALRFSSGFFPDNTVG